MSKKFVSEGKFEQIINKEIENLKCNSDLAIEYIDKDYEYYLTIVENQALYNVSKKYKIKK